MARIPYIEERLIRWAQGVTVGDGNGYPAMSIIHPSWQPPTPGQTPTLKVGVPSDTRQTHAAIQQLPPTLIKVVTAVYAKRMSAAEAAVHPEIACQERTVHDRVERAHRELAVILEEGWKCAPVRV